MTMTHRIFSTLSCFIVALTLSQTAHGQISNEIVSNYNAALADGPTDQLLSASRALAEAAMANPNDPEAVLLAYEAAVQFCIRRRCAEVT